LEQAETRLAEFKRTTSVNFSDIYHYSLFQHESGKAENLQQFTVIEKRKKEETYCTTQSGTEPLAPEGVAKKLKKTVVNIKFSSYLHLEIIYPLHTRGKRTPSNLL